MIDSMLFECKVYKPGKDAVIIPREEVIRRYWDNDEVRCSKRQINYVHRENKGGGPRKCATCGKDFIARTPYFKYCQDKACRNQRKREQKKASLARKKENQ